jgi:hypothetical protein
MKNYFYCSIVFLVFACKDKPAGGSPVGDARGSVAEPKKENRYSYDIADEILFVQDNQRKIADTILLGAFEYGQPKIVDMTDSLEWPHLLLQITWDDASDVRSCEFFEFNNGTIKSLFGMSYLNTIKRKDANTLVGFVSDRDEVVNDFQDDYPFTISLSNNKVDVEYPKVQLIGWPTEVLHEFTAYRIDQNGDTIHVDVKKGTSLIVDSIYRPSETVRLLIKDSLPLFIKIEKLDYKITTNTAG